MKNQERKIRLSDLVDRMMAEQNHNPRDYCFRYVVDRYPKATHDAFDFPGEYVDNLKVDAFTDDGRNLKMDCAQLVMPKGDITCKSTINVEHQTYPLKDEKVEVIYDYKIFLIHQTNIPSNSIVMTNMDIGQEVLLCESHDQTFKLHVNIATHEEITKRLTILKDIIKDKKKISQKEGMYFAYIAIFVKDYSKKIIIEISQLFSQINQIEPDLELDIHHILKKMIKEHFKDDENKCRELLTMISKSIFKKNLDGLTYKEKTEIRMNDLNQQIEQKDQQIEQQGHQLEQQGHQLEQKDQQIEQKDEENKKLKKEIEQLKQQISNQG